MQRFIAVDGIRIDWIGVEDRLANVAKRLVDSMRDDVNPLWLMVASKDNTGTLMRQQIFRERGLKRLWVVTYDSPKVQAD
jgi:hypothetical protein